MQLLLIDDDSSSAQWLAERLTGDGFIVTQVQSPDQALRQAFAERVAAVIVGVGPTGHEGSQYVQPLRDAGFDQPLMLLTSRGNWRDKVASLDAGADDYLIKPVRAEEVAARLRALIRRCAGSAGDRIVAGDLELDLKARIVRLGGSVLDLTRNEFRLLRMFLLRPERILAHEEIRDLLYPVALDRSHNAIEVHIARLRRKIGRDRVRTIRGVGYRFIAEPAFVSPSSSAEGSLCPTGQQSDEQAWFPEI